MVTDQDLVRADSLKPTLTVGVGQPQFLLLNAFCGWIEEAFGNYPYLVGSSAKGKQWRDVDVRLMLDDEVFDAMFPDHFGATQTDAKWSLLCAAIATLAKQQTGLPIDFQIQKRSRANELYPNEIRIALGVFIHKEDLA